ncbi:MAG: pilus assembly PilX family protein [Janthinobacterium lividum]
MRAAATRVTCSRARTRHPPASQHGIALASALMMLVLMTVLALSMFRGFGLQQKIAGNTREKQRAFQAAENALQYGEWWLMQGIVGFGIVCSTPVTINSASDMRACSNPLANASDPATWTAVSSYKPPPMVVAAGGGTATDGSGNKDINYAKVPGLYVAYIGLSPNGQQTLYSVTASGYGGSSNSTAVIQSVFAKAASSTALDTP